VTSFRVAIVIEDLDPPVNLPFPDPEPMRFPGPLVSAANVSFRYSLKAPLTLEDATLTIRAGDRVALVGKNGEGKSTLVKLLIGELNASKGVVERHPRLKLG
jgi:ATP-binding cassette subfamily F protein 3